MLKRVFKLFQIARKLSTSGAINTINQVHQIPVSINLFFSLISIGSKNKQLLRNVIKNSFILSTATGLVICIIFFFSKNYFIITMTDLPDIREISFNFSYWVIIIPFAASFCFQFDGIFVGASQTTELRNAMIVSVAIYIFVSFFLIASFGNAGLWLSLCLFFIARALTLFVYMPRIYGRIHE